MKKSVLTIEAPTLDDEAAAKLSAFLYELQLIFGLHYYPQSHRYARRNEKKVDDLPELPPDVDLF